MGLIATWIVTDTQGVGLFVVVLLTSLTCGALVIANSRLL